jgi:hypothetical protein
VEKHRGQSFELLGVNLDKNRTAAHAGMLKQNLPWRSWSDPDGAEIGALYGVQAIPAMCLIDANGVLRYKIGSENIGRLDGLIEKLVRETPR